MKTREEVLDKLSQLYERAMEANDLSIAARVLEMAANMFQ